MTWEAYNQFLPPSWVYALRFPSCWPQFAPCRSQQLRELLLQLGPCYVKLGQAEPAKMGCSACFTQEVHVAICTYIDIHKKICTWSLIDPFKLKDLLRIHRQEHSCLHLVYTLKFLKKRTKETTCNNEPPRELRRRWRIAPILWEMIIWPSLKLFRREMNETATMWALKEDLVVFKVLYGVKTNYLCSEAFFFLDYLVEGNEAPQDFPPFNCFEMQWDHFVFSK